jgi:hypothetical protein
MSCKVGKFTISSVPPTTMIVPASVSLEPSSEGAGFKKSGVACIYGRSIRYIDEGGLRFTYDIPVKDISEGNTDLDMGSEDLGEDVLHEGYEGIGFIEGEGKEGGTVVVGRKVRRKERDI